MGILLGALAGAGDYIAKSEQEKIKNLDQQELEAQRANLLQSKEMALAKFNQELKDTSANASRTQMVSAIDQGAKKIVNDRMAGNQVADASTWTPEQEAARNQGMGILSSSPRVRSQAAANAGYTDEAVKLDKVAESGAASVPWGSTRVDSEGNVIYDNGAALKGEINRDRADAAAARASGTGKVKPLDPAKVAQIVETMGNKAVLPPNPFQDPQAAALNGGKMPPDETGRASFTQLFGKQIEDGGEEVNITAAMNAAKSQYTKLNSAITTKVQQDFEGAFDKKGAWVAGEAVSKKVAEKYGFDPTGMSRFQVLSAARDAALRDSTDRLTSGEIAPAKEEAPKPKAEPKKEAPIVPAPKETKQAGILAPDKPKASASSPIFAVPAAIRDAEDESNFSKVIKPAVSSLGYGLETPEYAKLLATKIRLHQTLNPQERAQAQKLGLIK